MLPRVILHSSTSALTSEQLQDGEQMIYLKTQRHMQEVALNKCKETFENKVTTIHVKWSFTINCHYLISNA